MKKAKQLLTLTFALLVFLACKKDFSYEHAFGTLKDQNGFPLSMPINVFGSYRVDTVLNSTNYILQPVIIQIPGQYHIKSDTINGYSFTASGFFTHVGKDTVKLMATGKPIAASTNGFLFSFDTSNCPNYVTVNGIPDFNRTFTCNIDGVASVDLGGSAYISLNAISMGMTLLASCSNYNLKLELYNPYGLIQSGIFNSTITSTIYGILYYQEGQSVTSWWGGSRIPNSSFIISITQFSKTRVTGTFNGIIRDNNGTGTNFKTITNGVFDLPIY